MSEFSGGRLVLKKTGDSSFFFHGSNPCGYRHSGICSWLEFEKLQSGSSAPYPVQLRVCLHELQPRDEWLGPVRVDPDVLHWAPWSLGPRSFGFQSDGGEWGSEP